MHHHDCVTSLDRTVHTTPVFGHLVPGDFDNIRKLAFSRVSMVHPLSEQAAMKWHLATVSVRDAVDARNQSLGQIARGVNRVRRHFRDHLDDPRRGCKWSGEFLFQTPEKAMALI